MEAGNWALLQFSGRGTAKTLAINQYLEDKKIKGNKHIFI